jgi:hypothetical protein
LRLNNPTRISISIYQDAKGARIPTSRYLFFAEGPIYSADLGPISIKPICFPLLAIILGNNPLIVDTL